MTNLRAPFLLLLLAALACGRAVAGVEPGEVEIEALDLWFTPAGIGIATNGVVVRFSDGVLTARGATINTNTGDIVATGDARVQKLDETIQGEPLHYNYATSNLDTGAFRTGKPPAYAAGAGLHGGAADNTFIATNAFVTADDYANPLLRVRTSLLKIVPGERVTAHDAVLYAGGVPVFYFPYWSRGLGEHQNNFSFLPGYRSSYGPYLLSSYNWFYNDVLDGSFHADWREKRGFGVGPDLGLHLGQYGDAVFKYYYTHDQEPGLDFSNLPLPENRQRLYFSYNASPVTNLTFKAQAAWWSDPLVTHDFFESEYKKDTQPRTYFDASRVWPNWSLDALAQPRVNSFFETVERLPEARLSGFRQQVFSTPFYYESDSSAGWYRRMFADTNVVAAPFSAARADTFQQLTLPETFFGWLTVTPRAGGRFTYYSEAEGPGATTTEHYRTVFNTGAEVSTKASRLWSGAENHLLDVDGLRHIIEPSVNYAYVPSPNILPTQLPQFDYELPNSLRLLPVEFPEYNAIDSIDSQNVIRWGLVNRLQTKREGQLDDLVNWSVYMDWRLRPLSGQTTFSDVFSDLTLKPRTWLTLESETRYDISRGEFTLARHQLTLQPNNKWSWGFGHFYLRPGPLFGTGDNLFTSTFYYRFNENWGARISHHFEASTGTMQEQYYTIYRDLRSWTAALTFRVTDDLQRGKDYTVAVSFSFKAFPRFGLGEDTVSPSSLLGR